MEKYPEMQKVKHPIREKMTMLVLIALVPLLILTVYLLISLVNYSNAYDEIVSNMTIANSYNLDFKEEMDESIYKLVVGYVTFENIGENDLLADPETLLSDLRKDFETLEQITTDNDSRSWLQNLLRNIDTLENRIEDIRSNLAEGGHYDENIEMLDNNIYILTELIQDDIQYYIYYQTRSIEKLKVQLNKQVTFFIGIYAILLAVIVLVVGIFTSIIQKSIVRPIQELCHVTEQIASGDFEVRSGIRTNDELALLAGSVNDMTKHLEILVNKIKEDERKMHYAEVRLLQEQINPHFLYNALDAIVWLIEEGSTREAENMVISLSSFFRLVLSGGRELISIRDEELHIRSYLEIQKVRYRDILDYEIDIQSQLYPYTIVKMTLQPLVENALYHGIKNRRGKGKVKISGRMEEDKIILAVEDTGIGMETDTLMKLRKEITRPCKETDTGFGLANVSERIRMNFGPEYGLTIDSQKDAGTLVQVILPAQVLETAQTH